MQPQIPLVIRSKKLIKPATPTPQNLRKFKISSLDQIRPPEYVHYIFFYLAKDNDERTRFAERSKQLQLSLSEVLTLFYPLAGRYSEDDVFIDCNDHGVEYVETEVASHLAPVVLNRNLDSNQLHHLVPRQSESPTNPVLAVQYNMFECGGLVIGTSISNRTVDAFVYTKFIDGWATACRVKSIGKVHCPSFGLASLLPPRAMMPEVMPVSPLTPNVKFASRAFVFCGRAISNLREFAKSGGGKDSGKLARQPSRVQLVSALIWKALIGVEQAKHGQLRPSSITQMINLRGRTALPISDDCWGYFARPVLVQFKPDKRSNKVEFHELVNLVFDAITNAIADCAKPQNGDELFMMVNKAWKENAEVHSDAEVQSCFFISTCRMPFYPDFGYGKPNKVFRLKGFSDIRIVLMDTRDGDGVEASIILAENDMNLFEQDPDIKSFTSQVKQPDDRSTYLRSRC